MMNEKLIALVAVLYVAIGTQYALEGRYGFAITWMSYAVANAGLILAARS